MTDFADDAQLVETRERDTSIAMIRGRMPTLMVGDRTAPCTGCGDEIEEERRAALPGVLRCLQCQETRERLQRLFGKGVP